MEVEDGEGIAIHAIVKAELAFEVRRPDDIRRGGDRPLTGQRMAGRPARSAPGAHQTGAEEQCADGARRRPAGVGLEVAESIAELLGPIVRMLPAQCDDARFHVRAHAQRLSVGRMRAGTERCQPLTTKAREQLVSCLLANPEPRANVDDALGAIEAGLNEGNLF